MSRLDLHVRDRFSDEFSVEWLTIKRQRISSGNSRIYALIFPGSHSFSLSSPYLSIRVASAAVALEASYAVKGGTYLKFNAGHYCAQRDYSSLLRFSSTVNDKSITVCVNESSRLDSCVYASRALRKRNSEQAISTKQSWSDFAQLIWLF